MMDLEGSGDLKNKGQVSHNRIEFPNQQSEPKKSQRPKRIQDIFRHMHKRKMSTYIQDRQLDRKEYKGIQQQQGLGHWIESNIEVYNNNKGRVIRQRVIQRYIIATRLGSLDLKRVKVIEQKVDKRMKRMAQRSKAKGPELKRNPVQNPSQDYIDARSTPI